MELPPADQSCLNNTPLPSGVTSSSLKFTARSRRWWLDAYAKAEHDVYQAQGQRRRTEGDNPCPEAGYYFTPACQGSRHHFKYGEIMPKIGNAMWQTIWQWDDQQ